MHGMEERTVARTTTPRDDRRRSLLPMIIAAAIGFVCGWGLGDLGDSGVDHGLPGGPATDGVSGNSPSDRTGSD